METTALGAAYLAGLSVGYWCSGDQIDAQWKPERVFEPKMTADERDRLRGDWKRGVERAKAWARHAP